MTSPPVAEGDYVDADEYAAALRGTYFPPSGALDSRLVPQSAPIPGIGTWRLWSFSGLDGREIDELIEVPVEMLAIREDTGAIKRADVLRYAQWWQAGSEPPPISAVQCEKGYLVVSDHRRLLAAKLIGKPTIKVWANWLTTSVRGTETGLTFERRNGDRFPLAAAPADRRIFDDDARMLDRLRGEIEKAKEVAPEPVRAQIPRCRG